MRKALRWLGYVLAGIFVLALLFVAWVWFASGRVLGRVHEAAPERLGTPSAAQLADARAAGAHPRLLELPREPAAKGG